MHQGNGCSAKTLGKSVFHYQTDWSSNGPAGQFWQIENVLSLQGDMLELRIKGAVSWQSSSLCLILPITRPQLLWNLKYWVSKEITCKWQNQRSGTYKYVSWAPFLKLQAADLNIEKLLGGTVFKNLNFNFLQFYPSVASVVSVMLF